MYRPASFEHSQQPAAHKFLDPILAGRRELLIMPSFFEITIIGKLTAFGDNFCLSLLFKRNMASISQHHPSDHSSSSSSYCYHYSSSDQHSIII